MSSRNSSPTRPACALAALLCLLVSGCSTEQKQQQGKLTQEQVADLMQRWDAAQMNEDVEGVAACLSTKLQYKIYNKLSGTTDLMTGDYRKYIEATKKDFSVGNWVSTNRGMNGIALYPDGQRADVMAEIHDALIIEGRLYRTVSTGTMTVELEDGRPLITVIDQIVTRDFEGRQPFQTDRY